MVTPNDEYTIKYLKYVNDDLRSENELLSKQVDQLLKLVEHYREELSKYKPA
jgi:hypothetical protein